MVWRKDGPGLGQNSKVLSDNSLMIYPATSADQGLFGCEASNPAGSDYQASSLVLLSEFNCNEIEIYCSSVQMPLIQQFIALSTNVSWE